MVSKSNSNFKKIMIIIIMLIGGISIISIDSFHVQAANQYPPMNINGYHLKMNKKNTYSINKQPFEFYTTNFNADNRIVFNIQTKANAKLRIDTNNKHQYFYKVYKPKNGYYNIVVQNMFVKEGHYAPITFFVKSPSYSKMTASGIDIIPTNDSANYNG